VALFRSRLNRTHRLIFDIGESTGLRISDIIGLKKDVLKKEKPTIKEKKTGKSKRIYIPKSTREELKKYAEQSQNEYIFYSPLARSGHISRQAVWKAFKRAASACKASGNIAPHSTRKDYACKLLKKGKNFNYIQGKLNHTNSNDTLIYLLDELMKGD
jgi:integrase